MCLQQHGQPLDAHEGQGHGRASVLPKQLLRVQNRMRQVMVALIRRLLQVHIKLLEVLVHVQDEVAGLDLHKSVHCNPRSERLVIVHKSGAIITTNAAQHVAMVMLNLDVNAIIILLSWQQQ